MRREVGDDYRYRYAVLSGGEAVRRALRSAALDPGDSDDPGPNRRVALATYADYDDFLYRLPTYLSDVERGYQARLARVDRSDERVRDGRRGLSTFRRRHRARPPRDGSG